MLAAWVCCLKGQRAVSLRQCVSVNAGGLEFRSLVLSCRTFETPTITVGDSTVTSVILYHVVYVQQIATCYSW